jgi:type VI protein secretion system component Hcp
LLIGVAALSLERKSIVASGSADVYLKFEGQWGGKPLKGDCMDERHPGEEGWIQVQEFEFGFGAGDNADTFQVRTAAAKATTPEEIEKERNALLAERNALLAETRKPKGEKSWGKSGPLDFDKFSFSKSTDRLSPILVEMSHGGDYKIPAVTVEAVRYGGTGEDFKIPFVRLIFENVYVKSCKLNLVNDEMPSEDVEFEFDVVRMETLWTDNATGNRMPSEPIRIGWNLPEQKQA